MKVSVGIPAYNEEQNIGKLLRLLNEQAGIVISEIIVIASGCTDRTVEIVREATHEDPRVHLIIQPKRTGKAAAVNLFLEKAKEEICVLTGADILPEKNTLRELCRPFEDPKVGMTGARPVPVNSPKTFVGFCVTTMWELHHQIALRSAKCGETIAFRKVFKTIPPESPVDEASIEAAIRGHKLNIVYTPNAIVHNKGPITVREFIKQRKRVNAGHDWLKKHSRYVPSTGEKGLILKLTLQKMGWNMKQNLWLVGMALLEAWSKILARFDTFCGKKYTVWEMIPGSKNLSTKE